MSYKQFIDRAIQLAYANLGNTSPNPSVGAVIVKDEKIIAEGTTQPPGEDHAEIVCIKKCTKEQLKDAILYITLEPCCHKNKRTPPCTNRIIESGIKQVVIGTKDQNPEVNGKGIKQLEEANINIIDINLPEAKKAHEFFFHWITTKRPFITIKAALTQDGFMTWGDGIKKKITDETTSAKVHELRKQHDGILIGINTLLKDDPQLTTRLVTGRNPIKVILDSKLQTPTNARIFNDGKTIIYCTKEAQESKIQELSKKCEIVQVTEVNNLINLNDVLTDLGKRSITSVLVEGGAAMIASFLNQNLANKCIFFIGEMEVKRGAGFFSLIKENSLNLRDISTQKMSNSIMIEGYQK